MTDEEPNVNTSALPIKLILRGTGYEIITEGELSSLYQEIDVLVEFQNTLLEKIAPAVQILETEEAPTQEEVEATPTADIPAIQVVESISANLRSLFATPWGRNPRTMAEIMKSLEVNGIYVEMQNLSPTLLRLIRRGDLRRIRREGKWAYFQPPGRE